MKKWKLLVVLFVSLVMMFSLVGAAVAHPPAHVPDHVKERVSSKKKEHRFKDLDQAKWAIPFITQLTDKNVFAGYEDGTFRPNKPVTRAEAMATAVRLMGLDDEAAKVDPDVKLHFKDAKQIDKHYKWAKGSIVVGLENGLFEPSEDRFDPQKPASRVWVASLMVRALGLQDEALQRMTEIPEFKDAREIPAGSIGYVNVAVDENIVSGYTDNTFKPNKPVTRAEIAVLLAKTGEIIDEEKYNQVVGKVVAVEFAEGEEEGKVTLDSFTGERLTLAIRADLEVAFNENEYFLASQLRAGDLLDVKVENNTIVEAALLQDEDVNEEVAAVQKFKFELEHEDDSEYEIVYQQKRGKVYAKVEREAKKGSKERIVGEEAQEIVEALLAKLALSPDMSEKEIKERIFEVLELDAIDYEEVEIEIHFANGKKVKIEEEQGEHKDHKDRPSDRDQKQDQTKIKSFELEVEFKRDGELKVEYKNDRHAKIEIKYGNQKLELASKEAVEWIDQYIELPHSKDDIDREAFLNAALEATGLSKSDVKEFELEIKFTNGEKFEWEWEND